MADHTVHVGILEIELLIPHSQSLKAKRQVLRSLKDRVRTHYNVSLAEIGDQDKWQKSVLGVCSIGCDRGYVDGCLQKIVSFAETLRDVRVVRHNMEFV